MDSDSTERTSLRKISSEDCNLWRLASPKPIEHGESDLCVENFLAERLKREQLSGLRFEFFDAGLSGTGGDGLKRDGVERSKFQRIQGEGQASNDFRGSGRNGEEFRVFVQRGATGVVALGEPDLRASARPAISPDRSMTRAPLRLGKIEITLGEFRRACKENNPGLAEAIFFDRLNDGGFAAGFGKNSGERLFVDQTKIRGGEAAFFQERF